MLRSRTSESELRRTTNRAVFLAVSSVVGMALFHFSENPSIERFEPRAPLAHPDCEPFVWAIDEWHSPLYFLPSECPRVCFWPLPITSEEDRLRFPADTRMVIAIESSWFERVQTTPIYRYTFEPGEFESVEDHGVHVSRTAVVPKAVELIPDSLQAMSEADVELRICPSLVWLAEEVMKTTFHWSLIRMRNAQGWTREPGSPSVPRR